MIRWQSSTQFSYSGAEFADLFRHTSESSVVSHIVVEQHQQTITELASIAVDRLRVQAGAEQVDLLDHADYWTGSGLDTPDIDDVRAGRNGGIDRD